VRVVECEQNTPEWLNIRCGRVTASRMADVVAKRKSGSIVEMACRRDYRMELLCERLTGRTEDHYVSPEMDWGRENEKLARSAYEVVNEVMTDQIGFVLHPNMDFSGASPDSLVGEDGMLEIKCPKTFTHLQWGWAGVVPEEHQAQMMWGMACAEREWADFLSYDPRLPKGLRIFCCRLHRDEKRIAEMEFEAMIFNAEIDAMITKLRAPIWQPKMPAHFGDRETVRIGEVDVPSDIAEMIGEEIVP
jgi:putative phage-type endonuclease